MNLLARAFGPENLATDTVWAGDVTYVRTWEGWVYLSHGDRPGQPQGGGLGIG